MTDTSNDRGRPSGQQGSTPPGGAGRTYLIGVYPDDRTAGVAARAARDAGADPSGIHVDDPYDGATALRAEMREELEHSWFSPQVGALYPKESARSAALVLPVLALLGALVMLPFGFIEFGDMALWTRLLVMAIIGAVAGGAVGAIAGPGLGVRRPDDPLAAERGHVVRVDDSSPAVARALVDAGAIRVDEVQSLPGEDAPTGTVATHADQQRTAPAPVEDLRAGVQDVSKNITAEADNVSDDTPPEDQHRR